MADLLPYIVGALFAVLVPLAVLAAIVKHRREKRIEKADAIALLPPAANAAAAVDRPCPCGAAPTRPLPRTRMTDLFFFRWWRRVVEAFAPAEICEACGRYADAILDEKIAETVRLARARMEAEIARDMAAHERGVMGAVLDAVPDVARRAWKDRTKPAPPVRALRAANDDTGAEERTGT